MTAEEDAKAKEAEEASKKKVEQSFVKEDSKPPVSPPTGSFAKEKKVEKPEGEHIPTMGEVMLYIAKETHEINVKLESIVEDAKKRATTPQSPAPQPQPQAQTPTAPPVADDAKMVKIKVALSEYASLLEFDATSSNLVYIIKAKQFLGSDNFAKIAGIVRNTLGGQYVSQGKNSHFEISKAT